MMMANADQHFSALDYPILSLKIYCSLYPSLFDTDIHNDVLKKLHITPMPPLSQPQSESNFFCE